MSRPGKRSQRRDRGHAAAVAGATRSGRACETAHPQSVTTASCRVWLAGTGVLPRPRGWARHAVRRRCRPASPRFASEGVRLLPGPWQWCRCRIAALGARGLDVSTSWPLRLEAAGAEVLKVLKVDPGASWRADGGHGTPVPGVPAGTPSRTRSVVVLRKASSRGLPRSSQWKYSGEADDRSPRPAAEHPCWAFICAW